jgi:hypothetical protein
MTSLTRGRVSNWRCCQSLVQVAHGPKTVLCLFIGDWPRHTPGFWIPFLSPLTTCTDRGWGWKSKSQLSYDWQSVGQSVLVSGHRLEPAINFSISQKLSSDSCVSCNMGCPLWREDGSVITRTRATGPNQRCRSRVQVPQNLRLYLTVSFETGFPFCRLLRHAGLRWWYSNPPPHGRLGTLTLLVVI